MDVKIQTYREFACWLKGYEQSFLEDHPNKEEWEIIKKQIESLLSINSNIIPSLSQMPYVTPNTIRTSNITTAMD